MCPGAIGPVHRLASCLPWPVIFGECSMLKELDHWLRIRLRASSQLVWGPLAMFRGRPIALCGVTLFTLASLVAGLWAWDCGAFLAAAAYLQRWRGVLAPECRGPAPAMCSPSAPGHRRCRSVAISYATGLGYRALSRGVDRRWPPGEPLLSPHRIWAHSTLAYLVGE